MANYPRPAFHFQVSLGSEKVEFSEVSGLTQEVQLIEYRQGASPDYSTIKMPGLHKYNNITLKKGIMDNDNKFFDWLNTVKLNTITRKDLQISLLNEEHQPVMTWSAINAWPVKVEGPSLKANGNEVAIESIELAHEGLTLKNPG
jgi:phage tail-like protein